MSIKAISIILIGGVILTVAGYGGFLIYDTWPISEHSINKAGVFGDSFGVLTSLFSGLAFSGMIITILLQREELQLQRKELTENRKEFSKSANAQERNAQLSALAALLNEYNNQMLNNRDLLNNMQMGEQLINKGHFDKKLDNLELKKANITIRIRDILLDTGVEL